PTADAGHDATRAPSAPAMRGAATAAPARPRPAASGVHGSTLGSTAATAAAATTAVHTEGHRAPPASTMGCRNAPAAATTSASTPPPPNRMNAARRTPCADRVAARDTDSSASAGEPASPASGASSVAYAPHDAAPTAMASVSADTTPTWLATAGTSAHAPSETVAIKASAWDGAARGPASAHAEPDGGAPPTPLPTSN